MDKKYFPRISIAQLLVVVLLLGCLFALGTSYFKAKQSEAEISRLRAIAKDPVVLAHPKAILELNDGKNVSSSPPFLRHDGYWFSGNYHGNGATASSVEFSFTGRYLYSNRDEDLYLFFWSTTGRVRPNPRVMDYPNNHALVVVHAGEQTIMKDGSWTMRIVAPTRNDGALGH